MKTRLIEKIGYGFGDMSSNLFWKILANYLPFFYANIFGIRMGDAALLLLVTRIWDAVSDPMMGIIADRTHTRWGKYRPYLLWIAPFFSIAGILLFTTPDLGYAGKLIWAYVTYILMMTVYTAINVPYGAMLNVVTDDSDEKTVFSSFRMFFAYGGSFITLASWEPLCRLFSNMGQSLQQSWQHAMMVIAAAAFVLFVVCFLITREHVVVENTASVGADIRSLFRNGPWWILIIAALCFNLFNTVRATTVPFFFADVIGFDHDHLVLAALSIPFYAGLFLSIGEVSNMIGVAMTVSVSGRFGKKTTFIGVNACLIVLSVAFFFIPCTTTGFWLMLLMQVLISILTGVISPLVWSMYADVADYSELKFHTSSTGLIFSSSSMAQKFGGAIGGSAVLWLLAAVGYVTRTDEQMKTQMMIEQPDAAVNCLRYLLSFIPAAVAAVSMIACHFYPLTTERIRDIHGRLMEQRKIR